MTIFADTSANTAGGGEGQGGQVNLQPNLQHLLVYLIRHMYDIKPVFLTDIFDLQFVCGNI